MTLDSFMITRRNGLRTSFLKIIYFLAFALLLTYFLPIASTSKVHRAHDVHCNTKHGCVKMGVVTRCDTGKDPNQMDWNKSDPSLTHCATTSNLPQISTTKPYQLFANEKENRPIHECMDTALDYEKMYGDKIPSSGAHRPLWPYWGEYSYCPPQRWLHSMEHGGLVALYHPCSDPEQVDFLRMLVKSCLYRHIITPNKDLPPSYPFALLTWRNKLLLNSLDEEVIVDFIKEHALKGREQLSNQGQYNDGLIEKAQLVTNVEDSVLCPADLV